MVIITYTYLANIILGIFRGKVFLFSQIELNYQMTAGENNSVLDSLTHESSLSHIFQHRTKRLKAIITNCCFFFQNLV